MRLNNSNKPPKKYEGSCRDDKTGEGRFQALKKINTTVTIRSAKKKSLVNLSRNVCQQRKKYKGSYSCDKRREI